MEVKDHVVVIKRKNHTPERYVSSGTAIQSTTEGWVVTITDGQGAEKRGMKIVLTYQDKVKFEKFKAKG